MATDSDIFDVTHNVTHNVTQGITQKGEIDSLKVESLRFAQEHYENFPVASIVLPKHLRDPIALIYTFARQADDFADEGQHQPAWRLARLQGFKDELDLIGSNARSKSTFFTELGNMIRKHELPLAPFYDLLDAFSQDVTKARYASFFELLDYCRRSANPIDRKSVV